MTILETCPVSGIFRKSSFPHKYPSQRDYADKEETEAAEATNKPSFFNLTSWKPDHAHLLQENPYGNDDNHGSGTHY
jgi:hypothetical protein